MTRSLLALPVRWVVEVTARAAVPARPNTSRCSGAGSRRTGIRYRVSAATSSASSSRAKAAQSSHSAQTASPVSTSMVKRPWA